MEPIYHLFVSARSASDKTLQIPRELPTHVAGQPARYLWKDVIRVGRYVHPTQRFSLTVDRARMDRWVRAFGAMSANGLKMTVPVDHSDRARDNLGYLIDLRRVGDTLFGLHQLIGEEAARLAARNGVSLGIHPDFVDGQQRHYGEAIVHSSLTPVPVVPGQGDWKALAFSAAARGARSRSSRPFAADGPIVLTLAAAQERRKTMDITPEQIADLQRLLPGGETLSGDNWIDRVIEYLRQSTSADLSRAELQRQLDERDARIQALSLAVPRVPEGEAASALVMAAKAKRDLAVARGALSPAVADKLFARLVKAGDGRLNTLALSQFGGGDGCLALAVFEDLAENRPVALGESSGVQTLSRVVPDNGAVNPKLQERMIALASGKV